MDAINVIFESFGGEKVARIFRTYWLLLLVIKQVMFSLFTIDSVVEPVPLASKDETLKNITAVEENREESFTSFDLVRVLLVFAQPHPQMLIEGPNELISPNPSIQKNETL